MNQYYGNIKVKIDNLVNCIILKVITSCDPQSLLTKNEDVKPSSADIDKMLHDHLLTIGLDERQLPFPDSLEKGYGFSQLPKNDLLQTFLFFKEEVLLMHKNEPGLMDEFHTLCESYYRDTYKKKGIHRFCQDYKREYIIKSSDKRDEIDAWLYEQWINKRYPLENIRFFVERLGSYCQEKEQSAHSDSSETKKKIEKDTIPEIEALTRQWEEMNVISRFFKGKKIFDVYASTLSDYYLQQLQIETDECLASFFHVTRNGIEHLQTTVNAIYEILNENAKLSDHPFIEKETLSVLIPMIEKEHLSLSDIGMNSMTDVFCSLQEASYPEGNERVQNLRRELSDILIDKYLYQLEERYQQTFDVIIDDSGVKYTADKRILLKAPQDLTSYYIPEGVAKIYDSAFSGIASLEYIKIPEGVCAVGKYAFQGCSNLKEVILPKSVTQIGDYAFNGCTRLEDAVFLYRDISFNDELLFKDCPALKKERIKTYNSVITGWIFNAEKRSGIHKETGIELRYCFDNENGTIKTQLVDMSVRMKALRAQGYSQEEIDAIYRKVGREFVILCRSLH